MSSSQSQGSFDILYNTPTHGLESDSYILSSDTLYDLWTSPLHQIPRISFPLGFQQSQRLGGITRENTNPNNINQKTKYYDSTYIEYLNNGTLLINNKTINNVAVVVEQYYQTIENYSNQNGSWNLMSTNYPEQPETLKYYTQDNFLILEVSFDFDSFSQGAYVIGQMVYYEKTNNTGLRSNSEDSNIYIYPNPVTDIINVSVEHQESKKISYQIFDNMGKIVRSGTIENGIINISELSPGVYQLKSIMDDRSYINRIVKD